MEKHRCGFILIFSIIISLGIASFISCIAAEFKRTKKRDLKLDGKLCYLPGSHAFGYGIAALICLSVAQIIGNLVLLCRKFCWREKSSSCKAKKLTIASTLFVIISWMSFGMAVILISTATSMNKRQAYGKGWLDGKCYVVKDGVYFASALLVVLSIASTLISPIEPIRRTHVEQEQKVHAQAEE